MMSTFQCFYCLDNGLNNQFESQLRIVLKIKFTSPLGFISRFESYGTHDTQPNDAQYIGLSGQFK
jgi:hypothetical protein